MIAEEDEVDEEGEVEDEGKEGNTDDDGMLDEDGTANTFKADATGVMLVRLPSNGFGGDVFLSSDGAEPIEFESKSWGELA
jgi:hypothetical protein